MSFFPNSSHFNATGTFTSVGHDQYNSYYSNLNSEDRHQELLRRLDILNYRDDLAKNNDARLEGTCEWSKSHPLIRAWLDSPETDRLWLYGNPGTGKSTLAAYLVEQAVLQRDSSNQTVVYFFGNNKRQDNRRQNSESILKVFIVQLLQTNRVSKKDLDVLMDDVLSKGRDYRFSVRDLAKHLELLLNSFPKLYFVVDALDECDPDIAEPGGLIDVLTKMTIPIGKFLFLSRKEEYIQRRLDGWVKVEVGGDKTTQKDIQNFVSAQASELILQVPQLRFSEEELTKILLEAAGNMFLYVRLMVQNLIENRASTPQDLRNILSNSPKGLDEMYEQYFITLYKKNNERHNRIAVRALQLVLFSQAPMTLTMLNLMLSIDHDDNDLIPDKLHGNIEVALRQVLGILIDCRKPDEYSYRNNLPTHAVPVHQSLNDFLRRLIGPSRSVPPELHLLRDAMDSRAAHGELLGICCNFLRSRVVNLQLQNCHNSTDQQWQEHRQWWRNFRATEPDKRSHEFKHEQRRVKRRVLELKRLFKRLLRRERKLTERLAYQTVDLLEFVNMYSLDRLFEEDGVNGMDEISEMADSWMFLRRMVVARSVLQVPLSMQQSHQLWFLPELELALYLKEHFATHLAGVVGCGFDHPAVTGFIALLRTSLKHIVRFASDFASIINIENIQSPRDIDTTVNLANALASIPQTVASIENLLNFEQLHDPGIPWTITQYITQQYFTPYLTFNERLHQVINETPSNQEKERIKRLINLLTISLTQLQNVKFVLHRFHRRMPIVIGTSSLLYAIQNTKQMLARWMVLCVGLYRHEHQELVSLLTHDDFLHPQALRSSGSTHFEYSTVEYYNYHKHHNIDSDDDMSDDGHLEYDNNSLDNGLLSFDTTIWSRHPFSFSFTLLLGFFVGVMGFLPMWVPICSTTVTAQRYAQRYLCYYIPEGTFMFRMVPLTLLFVIVGQFVLLCVRIGVHSIGAIVMAAAIGLTLHISNLMRFSFILSSDGKFQFRLYQINLRLLKLVRVSIHCLVVIDRILPYDALWYGLSSASFGDISMRAPLNHVAVYIIMCKALSIAFDPLSHAKGIIKGIPDHFEKLYPGLTSRHYDAPDEIMSTDQLGTQMNDRHPGIFWPPPAGYTLTTGTEDSFLSMLYLSTDGTSHNE